MLIARSLIFLFVCGLVVSCNSIGNNEKNEQEKKIPEALEVLKNILSEINYEADITSEKEGLIITGNQLFTEGQEGNSLLMDYLQYRLGKEIGNEEAFSVVISYPVRTHGFYYSGVNENLLKWTGQSWEIIKHCLKNINYRDGVYFELSYEYISAKTNISFEGSTFWELIRGVLKNDPKAIGSFLAFYHWSDREWDDTLDFDQKKLDFVLNKLGYSKEDITESFLNDYYKGLGYQGYRK